MIMRWVRRIAAVVLFVLLFGFALGNSQTVMVRFYVLPDQHVPLILVILGSFAIGAATGALAMSWHWLQLRRQLSTANRELRAHAEAGRPEEKDLV